MNRKCQATEFYKAFDTEEKCLQYLCELKWGKGFICPKCNHTVSVKGRTWYYRRCQKCKHDESCYANTLFHKLRIPVTKAFHMVYQLSSLKKGMSCSEISRQYNVHLKTAWFFRSKIQKAMNEGAFKGFKSFIEEGKEVRIKRSKDDKLSRLSVKINCSVFNSQKAEISVIQSNFQHNKKQKWNKVMWIPNSAKIGSTNKFKKGINVNVELMQSEFSKATNLYIFNLKNWLAGIHHIVSLAHLQRYLNEFQYKYESRLAHQDSPLNMLFRFVKSPWLPYKWAKAN